MPDNEIEMIDAFVPTVDFRWRLVHGMRCLAERQQRWTNGACSQWRAVKTVVSAVPQQISAAEIGPLLDSMITRQQR